MSSSENESDTEEATFKQYQEGMCFNLNIFELSITKYTVYSLGVFKM